MKSRIINLDLIRIIGMVMVVILHTAVNFTLRSDFFATKLWFMLEPIVALSKTAVLLFFMLSGYLLISKKRSVGDNLKKTGQKLVIPLFFFSVVDSIINFLKFDLKEGSFVTFLVQELNRMMNEKSSPLWFLIVLVFLYLLNPLWQKIFEDKKDSTQALYLTSIALIFSVVMAIVEFPAQKEGILFTGATYWLGYVFFYLYGGALQLGLLGKPKQVINITLLITGLLMTIFGDFISLWAQIKNLDIIWSGYTNNFLSVPVIMMAVGLFNLIVGVRINISAKATRLIQWLASLSFGVYLVHGYLILFSRQGLGFKFDVLGMNVYLYNLIDVGTVLLFSVLITALWRKIPKLNALIGG